MRLSTPIWLLTFFFFGGIATAQPTDVYPLRQGPWTQSLNGAWKFRYAAGPMAPDIGFGAPDFDDSSWSGIPVPAHWELQGFAEPKYAKPDEGVGYYRRHFSLPESWNGQKIFLHFDGVLYGFTAWVNGQEVGSWASAYNPVAFDISSALKPGRDNVIAVRVTTRSHGWEFDTNDCWGLSGIFRDVTVFAAPPTHLVNFSTKVTGSTKSVAILLTAETNSLSAVSTRLIAPDGKVVAQESFSVTEKESSVPLHVNEPLLWTAETPRLYTLELSVSAAGQRTQIVTEKIGLRFITVKDGVLLLNGQPVKLHGLDHHDLWPEAGRVASEELMRKDLALMRAANVNFIRTSHYPPHPRFLELCDELGFYVMDEVPFGFGEEHLDDPAYQEDLLTRARATVRRDWNRACVVVWSVGNENPNTPLTIATARKAKQLDPTRPVCFPQMGWYFAKSYSELPDDIDIYAPHYPSTALVQEYATQLTRPIIFTEYAHALGLASDQIQAQWAIMQASPRIAGGAIWMFQDQGILRHTKEGQTPATSHDLSLAVWPDSSHYYDGAGNLGMDGIVYADRTPQVDYWQVRKVYSPVQISERAVSLPGRSGTLTLHVENRFDFRSLTGMSLEWSLRQNGRIVKTASIPLHAAAHQTEAVVLKVEAPTTSGAGFTSLETRVLDEKGISFHERAFPLTSPSSTSLLEAVLGAKSTGKLELNEHTGTSTLAHPDFSLSLSRETGQLVLRDRTGAELAAGFRPHVGRRFTEGEFVRSTREHTWTGTPFVLSPGAAITTEATDAGTTWHVRGHYVKAEAPDQALDGELNISVKSSGAIRVDYDFVPVNGKGLILEAGLELTAPTSASEFYWIGDGPYAGYPGKDALNEFGIFHLNRNDLYFQGNRRAVDLAALTSPSGSGWLLIPEKPADVSVENTAAGTVLSHNVLLSGRGTKFAAPDTFIKAEAAPHITGSFTLVVLPQKWPASLTSWMGAPAAARPFQPYYHSYDQ